MIAKCCPISYGAIAIAYALNVEKRGQVIATNYICSTDPSQIAQEFEIVNKEYTNIRNKYLRFEIGIAPKDEPRMTPQLLKQIVANFATEMGLSNSQYIAATHRNTDNLHIHLIANRISLNGEVYKANFVGNRSAKAAEHISRQLGLVIANEQRKDFAYKNRLQSQDPIREALLLKVRELAKIELQRSNSREKLFSNLGQMGVEFCGYYSKSGKLVGYRVNYNGYTYKASEVDRRLGLGMLYKHFETDFLPIVNKAKNKIPSQPSDGIKQSPLLANALERFKHMQSGTNMEEHRRKRLGEEDEEQVIER